MSGIEQRSARETHNLQVAGSNPAPATRTPKNNIMETPEKTVRQLFDEFKAKFTVDQVSHSKELSMVFAYLQYQCSMAHGMYIHIPGPIMQGLIEKHLGYTYEKSPAIADKAF